MVDGGPGSGKTTFILKFAKYLAVKFGKVLYISSEEFMTSTLNQKLEELEAVSENLFFADNLKYNLDDFQFVIIDSINDIGLKLSEYKEIKKEYPLTAFILVFQHTKADDYRGSKEWEHEMDIACRVEDGILSVYKNRYKFKGETLNIFEPISSLAIEEEKEEEKKENVKSDNGSIGNE
jgi:predicted ATP-dependent serine protease